MKYHLGIPISLRAFAYQSKRISLIRLYVKEPCQHDDPSVHLAWIPLCGTYQPKEAMMLHVSISAQPWKGHRYLTLLIVLSNWIASSGLSGYGEVEGLR